MKGYEFRNYKLSNSVPFIKIAIWLNYYITTKWPFKQLTVCIILNIVVLLKPCLQQQCCQENPFVSNICTGQCLFFKSENIILILLNQNCLQISSNCFISLKTITVILVDFWVGNPSKCLFK